MMPRAMCAKFFEKYSWNTLACQISVLITHTNLNVSKTRDKTYSVSAMEILVNRLTSMGMNVAEPKQVAILLVSLGDLTKHRSTVLPIRTMNLNAGTWDNLTMRIIGKQRERGSSAILEENRYPTGVLGAQRTTTMKTNKDFVCRECNKRVNYTRDSRYAKNKDYSDGERRIGNGCKGKRDRKSENDLRVELLEPGKVNATSGAVYERLCSLNHD